MIELIYNEEEFTSEEKSFEGPKNRKQMGEPGSCKKIFGERKINMWDLIDIWTYICNEYAFFHQKKRLRCWD